MAVQVATMGSPVQDSLDSGFLGSSAARQMLKPGSGLPYPGLSANKPLLLPNTG